MFKYRSPPFLSKTQTKKEMEEIKCQKSIIFMSTDKK
ncbi:RNA polymerase subunit sigma-70 [Enterococcus faecalis]|nr:RNA polymerase subunit sigma-70 [Enterococcus faecalis]